MKKKDTMISVLNQDPLAPAAARRARLNSIKKAVAAGTYHIETDRLADSLLRDLLWEEVLRNRRPHDEKK